MSPSTEPHAKRERGEKKTGRQIQGDGRCYCQCNGLVTAVFVSGFQKWNAQLSLNSADKTDFFLRILLLAKCKRCDGSGAGEEG